MFSQLLDHFRIGYYAQDARSQPAGRLIATGNQTVELVTEGRGWIECSDGEAEVTCGAIIWHRPGERTISRSDPRSPYHCLFVNFRHHGVDDLDSIRCIPRLTWWQDLAAVQDFARQALRLDIDASFDREALALHITGQLIYQAHRFLREQRSALLPAPLQQVIAHVEHHFDRELALDELAAVAGWSTVHLNAMCKQHLDMTPHQFLLDRRIRRARELLSTTAQRIGDIAAACGFASSSSFGRSFKRLVGCTPEHYRRRQAGLGTVAE